MYFYVLKRRKSNVSHDIRTPKFKSNELHVIWFSTERDIGELQIEPCSSNVVNWILRATLCKFQDQNTFVLRYYLTTCAALFILTNYTDYSS